MEIYCYIKKDGKKIVNINKPSLEEVYVSEKKTKIDWYAGTIGELAGIVIDSKKLDKFFKSDKVTNIELTESIRKEIIRSAVDNQALNLIIWVHKEIGE